MRTEIDPKQFVIAAYRNVLDREVDPQALHDWATGIEKKEVSPGTLINTLFNTGEFKTVQLYRDLWKALLPEHYGLNPASGAYVNLAYQCIMDRDAKEEELADWEPKLRRNQLTTRQFLQHLVDYRRTAEWGLGREFYESLHRARCQIVKQLPKAATILDLGGGDGTKQGAMISMGYPYAFQRLTIIEIPPEHRHEIYGDLGHFQELVQHPQGEIAWVYAFMTDLKRFAEQSLDLVFSGETMEHISRADGEVVCREVFRILKPGGHFCLDTPNRAVTKIHSPEGWMHPEHQHEYTHAELADMLRRHGFLIQEAKGITLAKESVRTGKFSTEECIKNEGVYEDIENCYLLYYKCQKPV